MSYFYAPSKEGKMGKMLLGEGETFAKRQKNLAGKIRQYNKVFIRTDMGSCQCGDFNSIVHRDGRVEGGHSPETGYGHGDALRFAMSAYEKDDLI